MNKITDEFLDRMSNYKHFNKNPFRELEQEQWLCYQPSANSSRRRRSNLTQTPIPISRAPRGIHFNFTGLRFNFTYHYHLDFLKGSFEIRFLFVARCSGCYDQECSDSLLVLVVCCYGNPDSCFCFGSFPYSGYCTALFAKSWAWWFCSGVVI
jgi:hypothetical protein